METAYLHVLIPKELHDDLKAAARAVRADDLSSWLRPELRRLAQRTLAKHATKKGDPQ